MSTKRQFAARKAAVTRSANAEARRVREREEAEAEARRLEKEEEDAAKQAALAAARKTERKGRRRKSADGSNYGSAHGPEYARLTKQRREREKAKPQPAATENENDDSRIESENDEEEAAKEAESREHRALERHNQIIVAGTRAMKAGGTKGEIALAMGSALLRRPRRSPSPSPSTDNLRNRSASPAPRPTVASLMQQLEDTKAELQSVRDEMKDVVRCERLDALQCIGCNEHLRCSQCHECIGCCEAGETCKLSGVPAHKRKFPSPFHVTYAKPPLSPDANADTASSS